MTRSSRALAILPVLLLVACGGHSAAPPASSAAPPASAAAPAMPLPLRGPEADAARVAHDVAVVKQAQDVANGVLQKAGDCVALKAGLADAQSTLDDTYERARTDAARATIINLRKQVQNAANACP